MARATAAAVIIGNEVLSAKVEERNGTWLTHRLRRRGVELRALSVVRDDVDAIVDAVLRARDEAEWVITSGGIGPTHDDLTVRAVALALGRRVCRVEAIEAAIRNRSLAEGKGEPSPQAFRLAEVPEGTELIENPGSSYPIFRCGPFFMLPGVPELFRRQLEVILPRLAGEALHYRELLVSISESEIAAALDAVALELPHVAIGSYPQFDPAVSYRVKLTLEHESEEEVGRAAAILRARLPAGALKGDPA